MAPGDVQAFHKSWSARGVNALVLWGYQHAATLGDWHLERLEGRRAYLLTASILQTDGIRLSQRPLTFVVAHGSGVWRWPVETLQITVDGRLAATCGPRKDE